MGKRRVGFTRQPFIWTMPKHTLLGTSAMTRIVGLLNAQRNWSDDKTPWLIPQWKPSCLAPSNGTLIDSSRPLQPQQARAARTQLAQVHLGRVGRLLLDPAALQRALGRAALALVLGQAGQHQILGLRAHLVPRLAVELDL